MRRRALEVTEAKRKSDSEKQNTKKMNKKKMEKKRKAEMNHRKEWIIANTKLQMASCQQEQKWRYNEEQETRNKKKE